MKNVIDQLLHTFIARFDKSPRLFSAPGRVNLIGEHTDYNDGFVLPMAINRRTYVAAARRSDRCVVAYSRNLEQEFRFDLDRPGRKQRGVWGDYVEGTARALLDRGWQLVGAELMIDSEIEAGAGLSASAALELAVGYALSALASDAVPDRRGLALAGQAAEHEYVGTLCGIMDQYISALGENGHALLIDCRSLEPVSVSLPTGVEFVVCDTQVKHALASSAYNQRHAECAEGVERLKAVLPEIRALRDVSPEALELHAGLLPPLIYRRCRHVITENGRTLEAAKALAHGEWQAMGALMAASHRSLRDDFEVSCGELDLAVEAALQVPGVYGARMTGGGFGGCTISLVEPSVTGALCGVLQERFEAAGYRRPEVFSTYACEGAREHQS